MVNIKNIVKLYKLFKINNSKLKFDHMINLVNKDTNLFFCP